MNHDISHLPRTVMYASRWPMFDVDFEVWAFPLSVSVIENRFVTIRLFCLGWHWGYTRFTTLK